jgi:DNA-directed RNA polymerase alpha subunit
MRKKNSMKNKVFDGVPVSTRLYWCLYNYEYTTWEQIANKSHQEIMRMNNLGRRTYKEIVEALRSKGLRQQETYLDIYGS